MSTMGVFFKTFQTFSILKMVGFQKQSSEVQKNVNSENPRVLRKNCFHWANVAGEVIFHI